MKRAGRIVGNNQHEESAIWPVWFAEQDAMEFRGFLINDRAGEGLV